MDNRLISLYLSRILSGYFIFLYKDQKYRLEYPDISIKYEAEILAEEEYENLKYVGWHTKESIVYELIRHGIWTHNGDNQLKSIDKQIENYKVDLYKNYINPKKVKSIKKNLESSRNTYNKLYQKRHSLDHITLEGYCEGLKNEFILTHSIYDKNNNLYFKEIDDYAVFNHMTFEISKHNIDISFFRKIARSDLWRNYWSANSTNVFDKPVINWTDEQKTLVALTKMYDGARESVDSPPENVFEDDDMFDGWMIAQRRESEKSKDQRRLESQLPGKLNKAGEVFLMASSKEEADHIYGMNDAQSRGVIKERHNFVDRNKDRQVNVTELPDVQRDIIIQSNEKRKNKG